MSAIGEFLMQRRVRPSKTTTEGETNRKDIITPYKSNCNGITMILEAEIRGDGWVLRSGLKVA